MTNSSTEHPATAKARVRQQLRGLLEILATEQDGLHYQVLMKRLREVLPPTEHELTTNNSGYLRYNTNAGFMSVDLVKAGWLLKQNGIWSITDAGREALVQYPDSYEFGEVAAEHYRKWKQQDSVDKPATENWDPVDALLARVPLGHWVAAGDLGKVSGFAPTSVGIHIWRAMPPRWHVVLRASGDLPASVYGVEDRAAEQRALLLAEGIPLDPGAPPALRVPLSDLQSLAADLFGVGRAWLVRGASVKGTSMVPEWMAEDFVSIPASRLPTLPLEVDAQGIKAAVEEGYSSLGYSQREAKVEEIKAFVQRMKVGNLVMATSGSDVYVGRINGEACQMDSSGLRSNLRRSVEWSNRDNPIDSSVLSDRLEGRLRSGSDVVDLTDVYDDVLALLELEDEDGSDDDTGAAVLPLVLPDDVADRLLIDPAWLTEFVELLRMKKQVILYGPPGTGKTFLAQEVAEALAGKGHVTLVQFHPSYAYEDFFEGYRPAGGVDGGVSLQLVPGPFRKVVDLARANPSEPYFLIIDEINRANLAKVFGELYFLLEYRERSIDLLYSSGDTGPAFSLPANVYIIGTMNTADRSIALVDAAMRRRFGFLSLHPEDERLDLVLRAWLAERGLPEDRADLLVELNRRISDKDFKIGPSYLMNSWAADDAGLERIWKTSILPLLEEYHVGEGLDVEKKYGLSTLRTALTATDPVLASEPAD